MVEKPVDKHEGDIRQLPAWSIPHRFAVLPLEGMTTPAEAPADVFTYGPLMVDVAVALKGPGVNWAAINAAIGLEWMNSLSSRGDLPLPPEEPQRFLGEIIETPLLAPVSDLEGFLRRSYGLTPGWAHNWDFFEDELDKAPRVPAAVLDAFAAEELPSARVLFERLKPYLDEAGAAGRDRRRVSRLSVDDLLGDDQDILGPRIILTPELFRTKDGAPIGIGFATRQLHHRVIAELLDVFTRRPVLAICAACHRLFVPPRGSARYCRRYFWDARTFKLLRGCVPDAKAAEILRIDPREYRREYERLSRAYSRARQRFGPDDPGTVERKRERDAWLDNAPREPGRPEKTVLPPSSAVPETRSGSAPTTTTRRRRKKNG